MEGGGGVLEKLPIVLIMAGTACITKRDIYHVLNTWENTHVCDYIHNIYRIVP